MSTASSSPSTTLNAILVGQSHAVHGIFPDGAVESLGNLQLGGRRTPLGDVAHMQQQGGFAAIFFHATGAHFDGGERCRRRPSFRPQSRTICRSPGFENHDRRSPGAPAEWDRSGHFYQLILRAAGRAARNRRSSRPAPRCPGLRQRWRPANFQRDRGTAARFRAIVPSHGRVGARRCTGRPASEVFRGRPRK